MEVQEEYERIYRYCYCRVRNRELAEDITQESFTRLWESGTYLENGRRLGYLYKTAKNLCIDRLRRRSPAPLEEDVPSPSGEEAAILRLDVRRALDRLDEEGRELLLLRYGDGVPISALCELTGFSRFAVYRRLRRAEAEFRKILIEEDLL